MTVLKWVFPRTRKADPASSRKNSLRMKGGVFAYFLARRGWKPGVGTFGLAFSSRLGTIQDVMNWYYIDGPRRVGPLPEPEWDALVREGKIRPETLVWHEGMDGRWLPYAQVAAGEKAAQRTEEPEETEEFFPVEEEEETPEAFAARMAEQDYDVPIRRCLAGAWEALQSRMFLLVGAYLLGVLLIGAGSALPVLGFAMSLLFQGVIMGGMFLIYLRTIRGEETRIEDLFAGFSSPLLKPLMLQTLVSSVVWQACFLPAFFGMKYLGVNPEQFGNPFSQEHMAGISDPQTVMVLLLLFLACSIPAVYFAFCWMFSIPLIVDRGMDFWPAMQLSRRKVLQHPWRIGVLSVVAGLASLGGIVLLIAGVILTLPLYHLAMLHQYEVMFGPKPTEREEKEDVE